MQSELKKKAILKRISALEKEIEKAYEYLENGSHEYWHRFKPWFKEKRIDGNAAPPHKGWVKNVFITRREKALKKAERLLDKF